MAVAAVAVLTRLAGPERAAAVAVVAAQTSACGTGTTAHGGRRERIGLGRRRCRFVWRGAARSEFGGGGGGGVTGGASALFGGGGGGTATAETRSSAARCGRDDTGTGRLAGLVDGATNGAEAVRRSAAQSLSKKAGPDHDKSHLYGDLHGCFGLATRGSAAQGGVAQGTIVFSQGGTGRLPLTMDVSAGPPLTFAVPDSLAGAGIYGKAGLGTLALTQRIETRKVSSDRGRHVGAWNEFAFGDERG